jgi:hypothetical protein
MDRTDLNRNVTVTAIATGDTLLINGHTWLRNKAN